MNWPIYVGAALDDAGLSPMAFRVFGHLARCAGGEEEAFPSISAINNKCGGRRESVIAAIRELEAVGIIEVTRKWGTRTAYRLSSKWADKPVTQTVPVTQTGVTSYPNGPDQLPAKPADQVPEPLQATKGIQLRYTTKVKARKRASGSCASSSPSDQKATDPPIPSDLQTPAFLEAWADYNEHRREMAPKKWTSIAKKKALKKCEQLGPDEAAAVLDRAVANGYQGFNFEPKNNASRKPKRPHDELGFPDL
jgi:hypothetical protein